ISYQQCHYTPDNWRNYTIIGTKGRIENFGDRTDDNVVIKLWNEKCHYNETGNAVYKVPADNREGDQLMLTEFIHFLKDENAPLLFPEEAPNSIAIGAAATESLRNGSMPQHLN
ncbi:MAG: oxidoreductase, partial [Lentisphaeria bacterium]|nr:oxidoreductase [Lentisphaeria bacterium]